jgi:hypothetical protein
VNFRPSHIPFARFVEWVEDRLLPAERTQLQSHLAVCHQCQAELARVERMIRAMADDKAVDPPPQVVNRALRIFDARRAPAAPTLAQQIIAALRFDSAQLSPALGLRSSAATVRQLIFSVGAFDIEVRITPPTANETEWTLTGQVLGSDVITGQVTLQGAGAAVAAPLVEPGEFILPPVAPGEYRLIVHMTAQELVVESLLVGVEG